MEITTQIKVRECRPIPNLSLQWRPACLQPVSSIPVMFNSIGNNKVKESLFVILPYFRHPLEYSTWAVSTSLVRIDRSKQASSVKVHTPGDPRGGISAHFLLEPRCAQNTNHQRRVKSHSHWRLHSFEVESISRPRIIRISFVPKRMDRLFPSKWPMFH